MVATGNRIGFRTGQPPYLRSHHVVTYVVGDNRRVAWIILGDARFNLTDDVSTHIGAFGKDTTAQSCKNGDQRAAKRKSNQCMQGV